MAGRPLNLPTDSGGLAPLFGRGLARVNEIGSFLDTTAKHAFNILRIAANVALTETVTVGNDVYEFDGIATTTGLTASAAAATGALTLTLTAHGLVVGDLIRLDNEIMRVGKVVDANTVYIAPKGGLGGIVSGRAAAGTTGATHSGATVFKSNIAGTIVAAGRYPIGLNSTLTPVVAAPALVGTINDHPAPYNSNQFYAAVAVDTNLPAGTYGVMVVASALGNVATVCSETLAGSGNKWDWGKFAGGSNPQHSRVYHGGHVISAEDVTKTQFNVPLDFFPLSAVYQLLRPSAGVYTALQTYDGTLTFTAPGSQEVTISLAGSTPEPAGFGGVTPPAIVTPTGGTYKLVVTVKGVDYTTAAINYNDAASVIATAILAATRADTTALSSDYANGGVTGSGGALPASPATMAFSGFNTFDISVAADAGANLTPAGGLYITSTPDSNGATPGVPVVATFTLGTSHDYVAGDILSYTFGE